LLSKIIKIRQLLLNL